MSWLARPRTGIYLIAVVLLAAALFSASALSAMGDADADIALPTAEWTDIVPADGQVAYPVQRPPVPIVFVSRGRLDTLDGVFVGPPVGPRGRDLAVGGALKVLYPDGRVVELTQGTGLFDVARPAVSFDGTRVVFAGIRALTDAWRIYEIKLDGSGFRQLTFDDRQVPVPVDPADWQRNIALFREYGDYDPVYLPDGRICFVSTRYMALSGSAGWRAGNLYIMNSDGSHLHRITSLRGGVMTPYALEDGRILFSALQDNVNPPSVAGTGLAPLPYDETDPTSRWTLWTCWPDGTDLRRYGYNRGGLEDWGGAFQARQMPNGDAAYTLAAAGDLLGSPLVTAVARLSPGLVDVNYAAGVGDPERAEAPHALSPAPLPDGRVAISFTPWASVQRNWQGRRTAQFDYGLYIIGGPEGVALLYNATETDELDPIAVYVRQGEKTIDSDSAEAVTDDPTLLLGTQAILHNRDVYADLPPEVMAEWSPRWGTVVAVDIYDDSQQWLTAPRFPLLERQMPRLVASAPVQADGSFTVQVPADRPLILVLRNANGVAVRYALSPVAPGVVGELRTASHGPIVARPGATVQCVGCHIGHMAAAEPTLEAAQTNIARLASATASSALDSFYRSAWRVNDGRLSDEFGRYDWVAREARPWIQLDWPSPVRVERMLIYPRRGEYAMIESAILSLSDGTRLSVGPFSDDGASLAVGLGGREITWARLAIMRATGSGVGLAEWVVHGMATALPDAPPAAPSGLTTTQGMLRLQWEPNAEANLAGYKVHYGLASGHYTATLDVGDVTTHLLRGLKDGVIYYVAVSAYNVAGREGPLSAEVQGLARAPQIKSVLPDSGATYGDTLITIHGAFFASEGVRVLVGGVPATGVQVMSSRSLMAITGAHLAGLADVVVINPDGNAGKLANGFLYQEPQPPDALSPTPTRTISPTATPTWTIPPTATRRATPTAYPTLTPTRGTPVSTKLWPTPTPRR